MSAYESTARNHRATQPVERFPAPQPEPRRAARPQAPLRVVGPAPVRPPVVRLVAALCVFAVIGLASTLWIHTMTAQDAYRLDDAQKAAATLKSQEDALAHQVDSLNDPASLAAKAAALGMVPNDAPIFVGPGGKILGATLPKGTKLVLPKTLPANGLVVLGTPTPTVSASPGTNGASGTAGTATSKGAAGTTATSPQLSPSPKAH